MATLHPFCWRGLNFLINVIIFYTELSESNVRLKLTVVDTVGFGDQIDKTDRYANTIFLKSVLNYHSQTHLIRPINTRNFCDELGVTN